MGTNLDINGFNPRTHVGCDTEQIGFIKVLPMFQSTHPRGVRHPRLYRVHHWHEVSIHAPTWGATHIQQISEYHITKVH